MEVWWEMQQLITKAQHDGQDRHTSVKFARKTAQIAAPRRPLARKTLWQMAWKASTEQLAWEDSREAGCVQHVKDGKPLTPHGAELLGVPWQEK